LVAIRPKRADGRIVAVETVIGGLLATAVVGLVDVYLGLPGPATVGLGVVAGMVVAVFVGLRSAVRREEADRARGPVWVRPRGDVKLRDVWGGVWVCPDLDGRRWHPVDGDGGLGAMSFGDLLQDRGPLVEHREEASG
jgi:hypothetical protein